MADAFLQTGAFANEADREAQSKDLLFCSDAFLAFPAVVNLAFACELYLKAFYIKNGLQEKGHELEKLFFDLPEHIKKQLSDSFDAKKKYPVTLKDTMIIHSKAFIRWRYAYEKENNNVEAYPDNLQLAAEVLKDFVYK